MEPTRWRGSWAGVGTKISPAEAASPLVSGAGAGVSEPVSRYPRPRSLSEMRRSADLPRSSGEGDAEAEAWTGRRRARGLEAEVAGRERRKEGCGESERSICLRGNGGLPVGSGAEGEGGFD